MNIFQGKKILFFAPKFFNYENEVIAKLRTMGAIVYAYDERPANNFYTKVMIRLSPKFMHFSIRRHFTRILNINSSVDFDYVFFLKGETIYLELINTIKSRFKNTKVLLYLIDSVKNYKQLIECLPLFDKALSFDLKDTKIYNKLIFRPLFYLDDYKKIIDLKNQEVKYDILFIGTVHSDRWIFLNIIAEQAKMHGLKVYYYLYFQSPIIFWVKKIISSKYRSIPISNVKFRAISKDEIIQLYNDSKCIIDIQHPNQTGLTIRTIEVIGAKRKLITCNSSIVNYDFYKRSNILLVNRNNPEIKWDILLSDYEILNDTIYYNYSIEKWLNDIFTF